MGKVAQKPNERTFSNSPLVDYTRISPNKSNGRIVPKDWANRWDGKLLDTITIHCVVGQTSVERLGEIFADPERKASSNYGIGPDGRIGMYVEEKDRSWCTGGEKTVLGMTGSMNDYRAITIEVASDTEYPYAVTDAAYEAIIRLCADICQRNGIKRMLWEADPNLVWDKSRENMTAHRWFAYKSCPGDYLYERFYDIAARVNAIIDPSPEPPKPKRVEEDGWWGRETTFALQDILGCIQLDAIVSRQPNGNRKYLANASVTSWEFKGWPWYVGGSAVIKTLQGIIGAQQDGYAGREFVDKLQHYLYNLGYYGGPFDNSMGPGTVTALQRWINNQ